MKIGKLDIGAWRYGGMKLNNPVVIAWRLSMLPILFAARLLLCVILLLGWGLDTAAQAWRDTQ